MKPNLFNYSVLTVGIIAAMGVTTATNAATPTGTGSDITVDVTNQATATYFVGTNTADKQSATSNTVTVKVNELSSFELLTDNTNKIINPQANQNVKFNHTLQNKGNVTDEYTIDIANVTNGAGTGQDDFDYSGYVITYTTNLNATSKTIANGGKITLAPNEIATINIVATSNSKRKVGDDGILTVTASSAYLKTKNPGTGTEATYTAINTDNAITKTPIYAITKSANTNLDNNIFDTANTSAYIDYTIIVKNEGNADAKAFNIVDALPTGLIVLTTTAPTSVVTGSTSGTASTAVTPTFTGSNNNKIVNVIGQNLKQGETITITFRAIKDSSVTTASGADLVNYAQVNDDTLNDTGITNADLVDRSDDKGTENNYEDTKLPVDKDGKDDNTDATVSTRNQVRNITISDDLKKEVALVSTGNIYQYTIKNENGENQRPDFVLRLPGNQLVIIDSKVSLNAYERMVSAETEEERKQNLSLHIAAVRKHIDSLSQKKYDDLKESLDFTIMFIPVEPAFLTAVQFDSQLWNYAYHKHIILLSPTNLIAYLKLISDVWKRDDHNQNALEIAERGGKMYDKFVSFVENLEKVGKNIDQAKNSYNDAFKQLTTGNDNLVTQTQKLKQLGAKNRKNLPSTLIENTENQIDFSE